MDELVFLLNHDNRLHQNHFLIHKKNYLFKKGCDLTIFGEPESNPDVPV